jgi:hypothetical protein
MDVTSYIKKSKPELKMPRTDPVTGVDSCGIRFEEPVLSGLIGVKHQLQQHAAGSPQTSAQIREIAPGGVTYIPPENYVTSGQDPRLRRDPLYSAQARQLDHPSLADPVIRHHLNLPPLPDPYENSPLRRYNEKHNP